MSRQPVTRTNTSQSTAEMAGPAAPEVTMPASGDFTADDVPEIEVVTDVDINAKAKKKWVDDMQFMNEPVKIRIHDTTDPNMEPRVPVCVNGEKAHPVFGNHLPRGVELVVKRCVAEQLARAKPINVRTVKTIDHDGNDTAKIVRTIGVMYPFELVDPKPRDLDWIKRIRAEM